MSAVKSIFEIQECNAYFEISVPSPELFKKVSDSLAHSINHALGIVSDNMSNDCDCINGITISLTDELLSRK